MSAICGVLHIDDKSVSLEKASEMMNNLNTYPMDTTNTYQEGQIFMGCSMKYITLESKQEKLPFYDYEAGLVITADAIIDNRSELFDLLDLPSNDRDSITDSYLILLAFKKWGKECPKYLVGDFTFAIWNVNKKELFCARDHVGSRTFYFYRGRNIFAFCTLAKPLLHVLEEEKKLNDEWIANFLSLRGPIHEVNPNQTVYMNIQQLLPAHTLSVSCDEITIKQYWDPLSLPEIHYDTDEEYENAFKNIFFEAVQCRLRSIGNVGAMMSGGLDSGSVACVAAQKLNEDGKRLKAFSSIPFLGYKNWLPKNNIANESEYINAIGEHAKNIDITYCTSEDKNSVTNIDEFIDFLEQPYKFVRNFYWINEIAKLASQNDCKVLLDGQFGNFTISYGNLPTYLVTLYKKGKWLTILRELKAISNFRNIKYTRAAKVFLKLILPDNMRNIYDKMKSNNKDEVLTPVNPEFAQKWKVYERFKMERIGPYEKIYNDLETERRLITKATLFSHMGAIDTKMSLKYGIAHRDPSRDKRVIEFCLRVPIEQYVRNARERFLIRRAMVEVLPDKVRLNYDTRGVQYADWIQRLSPIWKEVRLETMKLLNNANLNQYIDVQLIKEALDNIGDYPDEKKATSIQIIIITLILGRFINKFQEELK